MGSSFGQESYAFTLDECLEYAMNNNQNMLNADLEVEKQRKVIGETLSIGFPQVSGYLDVRNNFQVPTSFIPGEFFQQPGQFVPVQFSPQYGGNASVGLTQMVFNGSYFVGVQASKVFVELSSKQAEMTEIDIAQAVTTAFYSVLVNEEGLTLVNSNYDRLDSLLRETKLMFDNGFAEKIDVNRVQIEFNNAKTSRKIGTDILTISRQLLKFQMGMKLDTELEIIGTLNDLALEINNPTVKDFEYVDRIEYSILKTRESLAYFELKNNNSQYLPNIDFFLNIGATSASGTSSDVFDTSNWFTFGNYGLTLNLPIFDGLYKSYRVQQNKIKISQIQNDYEFLQNNIDLEILTARTNLENAIIDFNTQIENMSLSEEVYNVTKIKYQEGLGSNLEVIEADAAFKYAQNNYYNSMYEVLLSKIELEKAMGTLYRN
jgi:outer membrane protein TolC